MPKVEKRDAVLEPESLKPTLKDMPIIELVTNEVMKGTSVRKVKEMLNSEGYEIGANRTNKIINYVKQQIMESAEKNFDVNLGWCQTNLLEMHAEAVANNDNRMRLVVLKELISLWGLNRPREEQNDQKEITPDMIEEFERKLLR